MIPFLSIKQFFRDLRQQKLRTFMTMGGILWGTLAIVLLFAFGKGIQKAQIKSQKGMGENITIIWPGTTSKLWNGLPRGRDIRITDDDVSLMKARLSSVGRISPEYIRWSIPIEYNKIKSVQAVNGVWPEFGPMRNIIPEMGGRFINDLDMLQKRRVVFIGDRLKNELFGDEDAIGQYILINSMPFRVVGVLKPKEQDSSYSGRDNWKATIPLTTFKGMYSRNYPNNIVVQSKEGTSMATTKQDIYDIMAGKYDFDPSDTEALGMWDTTEGMEFFTNFFMAFRIFLVGIGIATLITGGIGVSNIMNVVLEERTKEIGIKMALGAKKKFVMMQFLTETLILTFVGGIIGWLIGFGIIKIFPMFQLDEFVGIPEIDYMGSLIAIVILGLVGLVSGYFPAKRAANLQPVQALKLF
ncbi:MAG: FtsX-like permease family protein [candidate division Zixibacteria bacterium]|nr:FtsX-like permease family protein [candidate division Zixibacteria bacterium]